MQESSEGRTGTEYEGSHPGAAATRSLWGKGVGSAEERKPMSDLNRGQIVCQVLLQGLPLLYDVVHELLTDLQQGTNSGFN